MGFYKITKFLGMPILFLLYACNLQSTIASNRNSSNPSEFINIVNAETVFNTNTINSKITLQNLPEKIIFNSTNLPDNQLEIKWAVEFDIDADGVNDYEIAVCNYKKPNSKQVKGSIMENTQKDLWKIKPNDGGDRMFSVEAHIKENTIFIETSLNENSSLIPWDPKGSISYRAYYSDGKHNYSDKFND